MSWLFLILLTLQTAGVFAFHLLYHEPWRDEAQHILLAMHTHGFSELWTALRYEGHPFVLHLLFKGLLTVLSPTASLAATGAVGYFILGLGTFLLFRRSGGNERLSALTAWVLSLTYAASYEMGVISRGYGLGMGLAFLGAAFFFKRGPSRGRADVAVGGLLLALSALTSFHAALLAGAMLIPFCLHWLSEREPGKTAWVAACWTAGFVVVMTLLWGFPDRMNSPTEIAVKPLAHKALEFLQRWMSGEAVGEIFDTFNDVFFQYPFPTHWWNVQYSAWLKGIGLRLFWGGFALTILHFLISFSRNPKERARLIPGLAAAILYTITLVFYFRHLYQPSFRHFLFLSHPWFTVLVWYWVDHFTRSPWRVEAAPLRHGERIYRQMTWVSAGALGVLAMLQVAASGLAYFSDFFWHFSHAAIARELIPDEENVTIATSWDAGLTAVALALPNVRLVSAQADGRPFTYIKWDHARWGKQIRVSELLARECREKRRLPERKLYFIDASYYEGEEFQLEEIFSADDSVPSSVLRERFRFYTVDCIGNERPTRQQAARRPPEIDPG